MEEGRKEHAWSNITTEPMLTLFKYAMEAAIFERNTSLKATEKDEHSRIGYSGDQKPSLVYPNRGDRRGKSRRKPLTDNRIEII